MHIAVVGGGPAGGWSAALLAGLGHQVTLFDAQAPWEKPCGGGITMKALDRFAIFDGSLTRKTVEQITISFGSDTAVTLRPASPPAVVSRADLGKCVLDHARRNGVHVVPERVSHVQRDGRSWKVSTRTGALHADFLIGADGATSLVRRLLSRPLPPEDLCITLGYFIPGDAPAHMKIFFLPSLEGYVWSFPRPNHISYGLITRSSPGWAARGKVLLGNFITADFGAEVMHQAEFYSAHVPCLSPPAWRKNIIAGDGWALVGDAAGLVDPITGEGIYFAFRSAEILAHTFGQSDAYIGKIWAEIGRDLARASHVYKRFYGSRFLGADFRKRTLQLAQRSATIREILDNLIAGDQSYLGLKRKLFYSLPAVCWDVLTRRNGA